MELDELEKRTFETQKYKNKVEKFIRKNRPVVLKLPMGMILDLLEEELNKKQEIRLWVIL